MPSLQLGALIHHGDLAALLSKLHQQVLADVGVGHFTAAEADGDLAAVAFGQELLGVFQLDIEVVDVNAGGHPDFLDLHHALIFAGFLLALGLLEPVLAVVHELAHGGHGVGGDFNQIQIALLGQAQSFLGGHDAQLFAGFRDQADLLVPDFFVGLMTCVSDGKAPPNKKINAAAGMAPASQKSPPSYPGEEVKPC